MFSPKEAQTDFRIYWLTIAVLIIASATAVLAIAYQNGLTYYMLRDGGALTEGQVTGIDAPTVIYSYVDAAGLEKSGKSKMTPLGSEQRSIGQKLVLLYDPENPEFIFPQDELNNLKVDYYFSLTALGAIGVALAMALIAILLHFRFIIRMRYY